MHSLLGKLLRAENHIWVFLEKNRYHHYHHSPPPPLKRTQFTQKEDLGKSNQKSTFFKLIHIRKEVERLKSDYLRLSQIVLIHILFI